MICNVICNVIYLKESVTRRLLHCAERVLISLQVLSCLLLCLKRSNQVIQAEARTTPCPHLLTLTCFSVTN